MKTHAQLLADVASKVVEQHRAEDKGRHGRPTTSLSSRIQEAAAPPQPAPMEFDDGWNYVLPERFLG